MKLTIEITCDNAAFADYPGDECARILTKFADSLIGCPDLVDIDTPLIDVNGNRVGEITVTD